MAGSAYGELLLITLAFAAGGLTKGLIGMALPIIAIAILLVALDPFSAIALTVVPIVTTNVWQAAGGGLGEIIKVSQRFWPMLATMALATCLTAWFAVNLPIAAVMITVGSVMVAFVVLRVAQPQVSLPQAWGPRAGIVAGLTSGLLGGASAVWGPPVHIYLIASHVDRDTWMRVLGLVYLLGACALLAGYLANGILDRATLALSMFACIPSFAGMWLGLRLQRRIPQDRFRNVILAVILLFGLNYIWRGVF